MGGIAGLVCTEEDGSPGEDEIVRVADSIGATGREEGSFFQNGPVAFGAASSPGSEAGVASRRLADGIVAAGFHGALYPLAKSPLGEVLDRYLAQGIEAVEQLRGDFVAVVWDGRDRTLHLVVDAFRVRPLFYARDTGRIRFGSKMRFLRAPSAARTIDPCAVIELVESSRISTPRTIYRELRKLPEGHRASVRNGSLSIVRYWRPDYRTPDRRRFAALAEELRRTFLDSVRVRLEVDRARGDVGAYLSGGIDSTTVVGVLTQLTGSPVQAFSIGFEEVGFNELEFARHAAEAFGAVHHVHLVTPEETRRAIPLLLDAFDEPFGNASAVPAYYCAAMAASRGVRTLYAGDGGDELFAGNEHYASRRVLEIYDHVPRPVRALLEPAAAAVSTLLPFGPFPKAHRYIQRARVRYPERLGSYRLYGVMSPADLFEPDFLARAGGTFDPFELQAERYRDAPADAELDRQLYVDLRLLITDSDLFKVTRTAEAAGIGVRFPFLDRALADFAARVPARRKMAGLELRTFFKRAYADLLPPKTRAKRKHGFGLPIAGWLRTDRALHEMMRDLVLGDRATGRGILRRSGAEELVRRHATDPTSFYGTVLWNLMILELWMQQHEHSAAGAPMGTVRC